MVMRTVSEIDCRHYEDMECTDQPNGINVTAVLLASIERKGAQAMRREERGVPVDTRHHLVFLLQRRGHSYTVVIATASDRLPVGKSAFAPGTRLTWK